MQDVSKPTQRKINADDFPPFDAVFGCLCLVVYNFRRGAGPGACIISTFEAWGLLHIQWGTMVAEVRTLCICVCNELILPSHGMMGETSGAAGSSGTRHTVACVILFRCPDSVPKDRTRTPRHGAGYAPLFWQRIEIFQGWLCFTQRLPVCDTNGPIWPSTGF